MSTYTFEFRHRVNEGSRFFYAIGPLPLIRSAAESAFSQLNWRAKWVKPFAGVKQSMLLHHPGGWSDRGISAFIQSALSRGHYGSDTITLAHQETNNPGVSLLEASLYLKCQWSAKTKQEERTIKLGLSSFTRRF